MVVQWWIRRGERRRMVDGTVGWDENVVGKGTAPFYTHPLAAAFELYSWKKNSTYLCFTAAD
jgi:hypothetical protein